MSAEPKRPSEKSLILAARESLLDTFETLTAKQWKTESLCSGWTVRDVAGHLIVAMKSDLFRVAPALLFAFGDFNTAMDREAKKESSKDTAALLETFRAAAKSVRPPIFLGTGSPLTDIVVHAFDVRIPLGLPTPNDPEALRAALQFRCHHPAGRFFGGTIPPRTALTTTDIDWTFGNPVNAEFLVTGPAEALLLTLTGRSVWRDRLAGDVERLA